MCGCWLPRSPVLVHRVIEWACKNRLPAYCESLQCKGIIGADCDDTLTFQHAFSCELDDAKRTFIKAAVDTPDEAMYVDARTLHEKADLPGCTTLAAGFPCQDVSCMSPAANAGKNTSIVKLGGGG